MGKYVNKTPQKIGEVEFKSLIDLDVDFAEQQKRDIDDKIRKLQVEKCEKICKEVADEITGKVICRTYEIDYETIGFKIIHVASVRALEICPVLVIEGETLEIFNSKNHVEKQTTTLQYKGKIETHIRTNQKSGIRTLGEFKVIDVKDVSKLVTPSLDKIKNFLETK